MYGLLVVAQERLARVQAHLGAPPSTLEPALEPTRIPTDVFNSLLAANQQVNVLLAEPASPGDVFQVVSWALAYALDLRATEPGARPPIPPGFEAGRVPGDVHARLRECLAILGRVSERDGREIVGLSVEGDRELRPNDVYDVASLVLAVLREMHRETGRPAPILIPHPGDREPSHVFQRAGMLRTVLLEIDEIAADEERRAAP